MKMFGLLSSREPSSVRWFGRSRRRQRQTRVWVAALKRRFEQFDGLHMDIRHGQDGDLAYFFEPAQAALLAAAPAVPCS